MIAASDTGLVPMRVSKAVALNGGDSDYMVLDELGGDRHLVISVGQTEALALDAGLQGLQWRRPMTYQFTRRMTQARLRCSGKPLPRTRCLCAGHRRATDALLVEF